MSPIELAAIGSFINGMAVMFSLLELSDIAAYCH
jgi:hypothetical protein